MSTATTHYFPRRGTIEPAERPRPHHGPHSASSPLDVAQRVAQLEHVANWELVDAYRVIDPICRLSDELTDAATVLVLECCARGLAPWAVKA